MSYYGSWAIDDLLTFCANTTRFDTGAATDADAAPAYRVYEDETGTPILTGTMALLDSTNTAGFYSEQITLSAANGFEVGKCYSIYISAAVNSVTGATHHNFQVGAKVNTTHAAGVAWGSGAITAASIAADAITAAKIADGAIDAATFAANAITATVIADGAIDAATFAAGAITATVIADGAIDAATFAAGAITATVIATGAIDADALAADAIAEIADGVWDEALAGHLSAGSTGEALNAAGAAGDPWITALPGAYGAGSAGFILGTNLNAPVGTVDTVVDAIKAKTDSLTFTVAGKVDANITHVIADPVQTNGSTTTNWGGA